MKMPEPIYLWRHEDVFGNEVGPPTPMFGAAEMKQYGRDLLEAAAQKAFSWNTAMTDTLAKEIRDMKEKL
jgi:hypothetical protein